jgi:hypothetical protein
MVHLKSIVAGVTGTGMTIMTLLNWTVGVTLVVALFLLVVLIIFTVKALEVEEDTTSTHRVRRFSIVRRGDAKRDD